MSEHKLTARASKASGDTHSRAHSSEDTPLNNPSNVEPIRFSARNAFESEGSSAGRIVLFVIVVIILGVGLTFLIQNFVASRNGTAGQSSSSSTSSAAGIKTEFLDIAGTTLPDSAASRVTSNELYTNSPLSLGSVNNVKADTKIEKLTHMVYDTFTTTSWTVTEGGTGMPATNISYDAASKAVQVKFTKLDVADASITGPFDIAVGNVTRITTQQQADSITFSLQLAAASKYYAYVVGGNTLALDIKTEDELTMPASTSSATASSSSSSSVSSSSSASSSSSSSATSSASSSTPTGSTNYDNQLSQNKQSVVSTVTGNTIYNDTYYYIDYGDSFQFSWAMRNTGPESIPNATAELVDQDGVPYVKVTINNLAQDILAAQGKTKATITINTSSTNLVDVTRESTTGGSNSFSGTSVYMVQLKHKGNFRLHSTLTYNNYQLLSLQLAD
jgi:hypothetical protein